MRAEDDFIPCRHEKCKDESVHPAHDADFALRPKAPRTKSALLASFVRPAIKRMTEDNHAIVDCPSCNGRGWLLNPCVICEYCMGSGETSLIRYHYFKQKSCP